MRMVRTAAALAGLTLLPSLLHAQSNGSSNGMKDSWFWGIHGGAMLFNAGFDEDVMVTAPTVGGEWLITRTNIALRISVQQAFFEEQSAVFDPTVAGAARPVDVKDWRRYAAEMYFMPSGDRGLVPYAGFGVALNVLQSATPAGSFTSPESLDSVFTLVDEFSSRASLVFTLGTQARIGRSGVFIQANAMPTKNQWLLNRSNFTIGLEAGVRYNIGSAIERF